MPDYSKYRISLTEEYGLTEANCGRVQLVNTPNWKTLYPKMYERYRAIGWTDDKLGKMTRFWAAWEDWVWGTSGLPFVAPDGSVMVCGSHRMVDVHKPWSFSVTSPITEAFGRYDFFNSHPKDASGSEIDIWLEQYVDDPTLTLVVPQLGTTAQKIRAGIVTTTVGRDGSAAGYTEVGQLTNVYFRGNRVGYHKQGELVVGRLGWDSGTNSSGGWWHSHGCDIPYMFVRGTPVNITGPITAMNCNVAGIAIVGGAQNSFNFSGGVEVDDCPTALITIPGFGREAGGRIKFNFIKIETAVSSESRGPWKGTIVADLNGQYNVDFGMVNYAAAFVHTDSLFVVDARLQNGSPQFSKFKAELQGYGYANLIHDKLNGRITSSPGDHASVEVKWKNDGTVVTDRTVTTVATTNKTTRLGFQRFVNGAWTPVLSHASATPAYNYQGAQTGGGVVVDPPPVDPPPVDPPPTTTTSQTINNASSASPKACTVAAVKSIEYTGLKVNSPNLATAFGGYLCDQVYCGFNGLYYGANVLVKAIQQGVSTNVTITFPTPVVLKQAVGPAAGQAGATWTATKVVLMG